MDIGIEMGQPVQDNWTGHSGQAVHMSRTRRTEGGAGGRGRGALWVMLRVRLLLGFYCDIMPRAPLRLLARLYSLAVAYLLIITITIYLTKYHMRILNFVPLFSEYIANVIISTMTEDKELFDFLKEIEIFDMEFGSDLPLLTNGLKYYYLGDFLLTIACSITYSLLMRHQTINSLSLLIGVLNFATSIGNFTRFLPLDLMRTRIKFLRRILQSKLEQDSCSHRARIEVINDTLRIYKTLVDGVINALSWQKILICISFVVSFIRFVMIGSDRIGHILKEDMSLTRIEKTIIFLLETVNLVILACLPSVLGELISSEVDKLKLVIGNQLLICDDAAVGAALSHAAEYLRERRARVTLGRACALDATLLLAYLSLCTTYFIVMIQFAGIM